MSLSFHTEHLAWQQRVGQEQSRSSRFAKNNEGLVKANRGSPAKVPFPKITQTDIETNYKSGGFNIAYAFGGTRHIKHVHSPEKKVSERTKESQLARDLKSQIKVERSKRIQAEKKLSHKS